MRKHDRALARLRAGCFVEPLTWDPARGRYLTVADLERRQRDEVISSAIFIATLVVFDLAAAAVIVHAILGW